MKGLLLKDFYTLIEYRKWFLSIAISLIIISFITAPSTEISIETHISYPCHYSGMISLLILCGGENNKWAEYRNILPYNKVQIVSARYLMELFIHLSLLILAGVFKLIGSISSNSFVLNDYLITMIIFMITSFIALSIYIPFMLTLNPIKQLIGYISIYAVVGAGGSVVQKLFSHNFQGKMTPWGILLILFVAAIVLYALSWYLSITFYRKREAK